MARAKRQLKLDHLEYLAVFEATKRGEPHLHILARCGFIPQRWLSAQLNEILRSPIVDIRQVKSARMAAAYVAKYIGKAPHRFATCKRYWHTKKWVVTDPATENKNPWDTGTWQIDERPLWAIKEQWRFCRYQIEEMPGGMLHYTVPQWVNDYFPALAPRPRPP